ncbi:Retrovirus-related Pol polyprotein LINE-1 [Gossypium australe]|uniref:Retrovirus-related Pol polyprotein LINE-1 n=1 Tax=Gossypium australe TaxID=47621 RepID=A0A5B6WMM3_9ROSI|nr:Retrovirus-related Pol polyprotein LINE-1 [Gossypium australe]
MIEVEFNSLQSSIASKEIKKVVFDMDHLKAPRVDGIHAIFYQKKWYVVGQSVCDFVKNIWSGGSIKCWLNHTLLVLIPKSLFQFQPISLCTVLYKIVTKTIVNRLKPLMQKWVLLNQSCFVPKQSIIDNIVVAQEIIHSMRSKVGKKGNLQHLIIHYISSSIMHVPWNGSLTKVFTPSRGIRQGDPISPYIFVLCMERLTQIINVEVLNRGSKPIKLSRDGPSISHLFFGCLGDFV